MVVFAPRVATVSLFAWVLLAHAGPVSVGQLPFKGKYYDVQGHRGTRGEAIESTLPAFAWGLIDGVTTLELDNGITKDGVVIAWHDEELTSDKCQDTQPVFKGDPAFPYLGKHIANLTLAQLKTVDCGSKRLSGFPLQLTYPGTRISTLDEVFSFVRCVDTDRKVNFNIESKINPVQTNSTRGVEDFVQAQHQVFRKSGYPLSHITYQSFDWRTLIRMKEVDPGMTTAALIDSNTASQSEAWLAGLRWDGFPGDSAGVQIANAAKFIRADILSPAAVAGTSQGQDPAEAGYVAFATKEMIERAHEVGMLVKPWTVNRLNIADQLLGWKADGIITDYPTEIRRLVEQKGATVAPPFAKDRVLACLAKHQ